MLSEHRVRAAPPQKPGVAVRGTSRHTSGTGRDFRRRHGGFPRRHGHDGRAVRPGHVRLGLGFRRGQRPGHRRQRECPGPAAVAAASASAPAPAASASASAAPCPSASASGTAAATTTVAIGIPPINPPGRAGAAGSNAVDAAGNAFSFTQTTAEAANSTNCTVSVPANPLSAAGLATPWELGDGCTWANGGTEGVFIDATILSPNGQLQVYNPLVIDQGTKPAVAPVAPTIARGLAGHPQPRLQRQRAGPGRPRHQAGQLHRRARELGDQPDPAVQRGQLLPDGQRRDRPRHPEGPGHRHRPGRPGLPDHA